MLNLQTGFNIQYRKTKECVTCGKVFKVINRQQKFCHNPCKSASYKPGEGLKK